MICKQIARLMLLITSLFCHQTYAVTPAEVAECKEQKAQVNQEFKAFYAAEKERCEEVRYTELDCGLADRKLREGGGDSTDPRLVYHRRYESYNEQQLELSDRCSQLEKQAELDRLAEVSRGAPEFELIGSWRPRSEILDYADRTGGEIYIFDDDADEAYERDMKTWNRRCNPPRDERSVDQCARHRDVAEDRRRQGIVHFTISYAEGEMNLCGAPLESVSVTGMEREPVVSGLPQYLEFKFDWYQDKTGASNISAPCGGRDGFSNAGDFIQYKRPGT